MKMLRQTIGFLLAGVLLFFLIKPFLTTHAHLESDTFEIQRGWLVASFLLILAYRSLYIFPFAILLSELMAKHVSFRATFTLFHLTNITRYLPGRIWGIVRLLVLSNRFGVSKTAAASSITLHVGTETALGGLIAMNLLLSQKMRATAIEVLEPFSENALFLTVAALALGAGLLICVPKLARHAEGFVRTLMPVLKDTRLWVTLIGTHLLLWLCQGGAFFLFVRSFASVSFRDAGVLTACFAFAWIVGFLSFLTPGGLGVREGLLGLVLSAFMPVSAATTVALLARLWMLLAEIVLAGIAFGLDRRSRSTETIENLAPPSPAETPTKGVR